MSSLRALACLPRLLQSAELELLVSLANGPSLREPEAVESERGADAPTFGHTSFGYCRCSCADLLETSSARRITSSVETSSLCVAIVHTWPNGSSMVPERSP